MNFRRVFLQLFVAILIAPSAFSQVGVGVVNPQYMLDVRGQIRMRFDSTNQLYPALIFNKINNEPAFSLEAVSDSAVGFLPILPIAFNQPRSAIVLNQFKGRLGLQRESSSFSTPSILDPQYPLHVRTSDSIGLFLERPLNSGLFPSVGSGSGILIRNGQFYTGAIRVINSSSLSADMRFYVGGSNTISDLKERFTILSNGNTGINQTNPQARLHVSTLDTTIGLFSNTTALATGVKSQILLGTGNYYTGVVGTRGTGPNEAAMFFSTYSSSQPGDLLERLTISDIGKIGINKNNPDFRLHVSDADSSVVAIENSTTLANTVKTQLLLKTGNYFTGAIGTRGASSNAAAFYISTFSGTQSSLLRERFTILDNGNTGIGTNAPTALLDVNGTVRLRNGAANGAVLTSDANGNATWQSLPAARGFTVYTNGTQNFTGSSFRTVRFLGTEYEQNISFNDSVMIAPLDGIYHFNFSLNNIGYSVPGAGMSDLISFRLLSSTNQTRFFIYPIRGETNGQLFFTGSTDLYLVAGEAVKFQMALPDATSGASVFSGINNFSCHLVR